jgi:hypothetical protein
MRYQIRIINSACGFAAPPHQEVQAWGCLTHSPAGCVHVHAKKTHCHETVKGIFTSIQHTCEGEMMDSNISSCDSVDTRFGPKGEVSDHPLFKFRGA